MHVFKQMHQRDIHISPRNYCFFIFLLFNFECVFKSLSSRNIVVAITFFIFLCNRCVCIVCLLINVSQFIFPHLSFATPFPCYYSIISSMKILNNGYKYNAHLYRLLFDSIERKNLPF